MKQKGSLLILLLLAGVIVYAATRKPKRRGSIEIGPLDKGEYITDPADLLSDYEKSMFEI
jgi:hypothetical protein